VDDLKQVDFTRTFVFLSKTEDEISLVCESAYAPPTAIATEAGWRALKISGILEFGMVGVIAKLANLLADAGISIFVISTYNTDYILVKAERFDESIQMLVCNGYVIN